MEEKNLRNQVARSPIQPALSWITFDGQSTKSKQNIGPKHSTQMTGKHKSSWGAKTTCASYPLPTQSVRSLHEFRTRTVYLLCAMRDPNRENEENRDGTIGSAVFIFCDTHIEPPHTPTQSHRAKDFSFKRVTKIFIIRRFWYFSLELWNYFNSAREFVKILVLWTLFTLTSSSSSLPRCHSCLHNQIFTQWLSEMISTNFHQTLHRFHFRFVSLPNKASQIYLETRNHEFKVSKCDQSLPSTIY